MSAGSPRQLGVAGFRESLVLGPEATGILPRVPVARRRTDEGVALQVYDPPGTGARRPALVYLHGGAFIRGSLASADPVCRRIADQAGAVVISVDYRLAPEHPFPAALSDAESALAWTIAHSPELGIDPGAIAIGGDSAGATLATAVARSEPGVALQVLLCGLYDLGAELEPVGGVGRELDTAREQDTLDWVASLYLPMGASHDPRANPLRADRHTGAPDALIVTSDLDVFAAQNRLYASALDRDGVRVEYHQFIGVPHAFTNFAGRHAEALSVFALVAAALRRLGSGSGRDERSESTGGHRAASRVRSDLRGSPPADPVGRLG